MIFKNGTLETNLNIKYIYIEKVSRRTKDTSIGFVLAEMYK